jgi:radical SAM superfamily enzyme YgiQ (UPF0313 family)
MRVALVTVYSHAGCTMKDVAGGYGTVFEVGRSLPARLLERAKSRLADLPPLVLGYLAAQLRAAGHRVSVHELRSDADPLPRADVAVVLSSLVDAEAERRAAERLREAGVRTIVVGAYASARPEGYAAVADAVVVGEPEALGADLLEAEGVTPAGQVDDLDALPWPDWDGFDVRRYRYAFLSRRTPTLPVGSARGCAYGCGYCPWRVTAAFRERDPAEVGAEVARLRERWGVRAVAFRDPLFNLRPERVRALAAHLSPLDVRFSAEMRADRLDESLLLTLWRAGLRSLEIGVESVNRDMLTREKRRPPDAAQVERVVEVAQRLGVRVICNYVLGLPEDDEESIRATVAWAKRLDSFAVQFTVATPYPGTTLEPRLRARMLPVAESDLTGFRPTFRHAALSPERLGELREWAYLTYHFRPRYAWRFARHAAAALWWD